MRHFNIKKIINLLKRKLYWSHLRQNIKAYVKKCDLCQHSKTSQHCFYDELQILSISKRLWEEIFLDFITKLLLSCYKKMMYDSILIVVCWYTKMILYISTQFIWTAKNLVDILMNQILLIFEDVVSIVSNWDILFISEYWSVIYYLLRIKRKLSTTFHSQINEQTKRQN